jgi:hypothetical protein
MVIYRVIFTQELIDLTDEATTQEEYNKNLLSARDLLYTDIVEEFGDTAIDNSVRVLSVVEKHDEILDILRIKIDNS